jgi:plasmid maintenance system antidote protein VapI
MHVRYLYGIRICPVNGAHTIYALDRHLPPMYAFRVSNDDPVDNGDLVAWLAAGLDRKGKTQAGLADALSLSQPRISEILNGKRRIQATEVPKIAKYIGQSPPSKWLKTDLSQNDNQPDPSAKNRRDIRFALHADPNLVWVLIFRDNKLIDQFEADAGDLDNLSRQVGRAIQSLPKPK